MQAFAYSVEILKIMTMSDDVEDQDDGDDNEHDHNHDDEDEDGVGVVGQERRCPINPPTSSAFSATLSLRLCSIHPSL